MAAKKRKSNSPVDRQSIRDRLFNEFQRFSFFQAVHLLETLSPERQALGAGLEPGKETVRFSVKPGLAFPAADILSLEQGKDGSPPRMSVAFMGLIGPSGVLPYWYNELALERIRNKDTTLCSFLDIFHHRLISLFYLAWKKQRFPENYAPEGKDRLTGYLLSLCGLGTPQLSHRIGLSPESLVFYTGLISRQAPSACAIEATVAYLSGNPVSVEQFVERTIEISPEERTHLGDVNSELGISTVCGSCVHDCQSSFRIHLGPMHYEEFDRFLPTTGDLIRPIFSLVRFMVGMEYDFDIRIRLPHEEIPPCELGGERKLQLGWTTWLRSPHEELVSDVFLTLQEGDVMHAPLQ
ncbi:MAG TPA: type VI secretion system baseplate subunit TssG [Deltaproteobacteria bacterium]|nr:type VI secretion system baseplate subunit TssG [Deltaproteobacteria bacterium]